MTQNRKLHQAVETVCSRKNHPEQFVSIPPVHFLHIFYFNWLIELSKAFGNPELSSRIETKKWNIWYNAQKLDSKCDILAEKILGKDDPLVARGFGKPGSLKDHFARK